MQWRYLEYDTRKAPIQLLLCKGFMAQFLGRICFAVTGSATIQTGVSLPLCFESSQRGIWSNEWSDSWGQSYKSCSPSQIFTNHELQIDQREDLSHNTHDSDDLERFEQCRQTHSCPSTYCGSTVQYMWPVRTGKELRLQFLRPVKQRCEIDMCLWQHARLWLVHSCSHLQQIYKTSTQLQCVPSVTDAPRFETLKVSANDFSQCSWSVGISKRDKNKLGFMQMKPSNAS